MITCIINGLAAYPAANQSIKITYANQYVTDDGEYSYDINFPMSIIDNRRVFNNVSRFDVSKNTKKYDDCKLYVSGRLILSGVGTIIGVTESEIKLQIIGGKSRIKFNEKLTKHYIDEIDMGEASAPGTTANIANIYMLDDKRAQRDLYTLSSDQSQFLGELGKWCYMPIRDETNDIIANFVGYDYTDDYVGKKSYIRNIAVQPNLMYIFKKIVEYEGYKLVRNDIDCSPWNLLYIASAYKTRDLRRALPHWSAYTFIEEFRKLFNATIYFDDIKKTCQVIKESEVSSTSSVRIESVDEYNTEYDADGSLNISSTANLEYNLGNSTNRGEYEIIPQKVFDNFKTEDVIGTLGEANQFADSTQGWSEKQKFTTIIRWQGRFFIYTEDTEGNRKWKQAGVWSPLVRDKSTDNYIKLNISPAAQVAEDVNFKPPIKNLKNLTEKRCLLSIPNDKESEAKEAKTEDNGYSYVSVQDAIDDESTLDDQEDEEECMSIFFIIPGEVQKYEHPLSTNISVIGKNSRWPQFVTDNSINEEYRMSNKTSLDQPQIAPLLSLALNPGWFQDSCLGSLHTNNLIIDNKNCIEVKFSSENIPDPSKSYIIHNKKFVCEKIELDIKDDEIEPIYTGYFYMLS